MDDPCFLDMDRVIRTHRSLIETYGGSEGLRDAGLLHSAVAMPQASFGGQYLHNDLFEIAAAYLYHILQNHPFLDGNKRTGAAAAIIFLAMNDIEGEYEVPEWNMGHVAGYAELAMLMAPRPFMVEQRYRDGGAPTEWVAGEYGKVRRHYDLLKIGERPEIELFDGPHTIHGQDTFRFLHWHLDWPAP